MVGSRVSGGRDEQSRESANLDDDLELAKVLGGHGPDGTESLGDRGERFGKVVSNMQHALTRVGGRQGLTLDDDRGEQVDRDLPPDLAVVELLEEQSAWWTWSAHASITSRRCSIPPEVERLWIKDGQQLA